MKTIALIGSIGSGKSTVRQIIQNLNIPKFNIGTIDLDLAVKIFISTNTAYKADLAAVFGTEVIQDDDKKRKNFILNTIFTNDVKYKKLTAITSHYVIPFIKAQIAEYKKNDTDLLVFEGATLIHDTAALALFDSVIHVSAPSELIEQRVNDRKQYTAEQAQWLILRSNPLYSQTYLEYNINRTRSTPPSTQQTFNIDTDSTFLHLHYDVEQAIFHVFFPLNVSHKTLFDFVHRPFPVKSNMDEITMLNRSNAYHNMHHTQSVFINTVLRLWFGGLDINSDDGFTALLAAAYHDAVYFPKSNNNENDSIELLFQHASDWRKAGLSIAGMSNILNIAASYIQKTKDIWSSTKEWPPYSYGHHFMMSDLAVFTYATPAVLQYEDAIRKEYLDVSDEEYKLHRLAFIQNKLIPLFQIEFVGEEYTKIHENVTALVEYIKYKYPDSTKLVSPGVYIHSSETEFVPPVWRDYYIEVQAYLDTMDVPAFDDSTNSANQLLTRVQYISKPPAQHDFYEHQWKDTHSFLDNNKLPKNDNLVIRVRDLVNQNYHLAQDLMLLANNCSAAAFGDVDHWDEMNFNDFVVAVTKAFQHCTNVAVYQGSFSPLHKGHLETINEALKTFDKVLLVQCKNGAKDNSICYHIDEKKLPENCVLLQWEDSFADCLLHLYQYAEPKQKFTIIRGIRNGTDLQYENDYIRHVKAMFQAQQKAGEIHRTFPGVMYIPSAPEFEHISSSAIKAIYLFDADYAASLMV